MTVRENEVPIILFYYLFHTAHVITIKNIKTFSCKYVAANIV